MPTGWLPIWLATYRVGYLPGWPAAAINTACIRAAVNRTAAVPNQRKLTITGYQAHRHYSKTPLFVSPSYLASVTTPSYSRLAM